MGGKVPLGVPSRFGVVLIENTKQVLLARPLLEVQELVHPQQGFIRWQYYIVVKCVKKFFLKGVMGLGVGGRRAVCRSIF